MENALTKTSQWKESYERVVGTIEALPEEAAYPVNVGTLAAALSGFKKLSKIAEQRDAIAEKIPDFDFEAFDALGDYARAALYIHMELQATFVRPETMCHLARTVVNRRAKLFAEARSLVRRGVLAPETIRGVRGAARYDVVWDLSLLVAVLRRKWSSLRTCTALSEEEIEETADLISKMHGLLGMKRVERETPEKIRLRSKAFSLFSRTYDEARRAILLIHGEEEGTKIAPKLFRVPLEQRSALEEPPFSRQTNRSKPRTSLYVFFMLYRFFPEYRKTVLPSGGYEKRASFVS